LEEAVVTLIFVAVIVAAFAIDAWFIRPWEERRRPRKPVDVGARHEFVVPRTLFLHPGHTWARLDADGRVTIGLDDFARTLIGKLSAIEMPPVGSRLEAGGPAFVVRQGKRWLRFPAPVSGVVTEVNAKLGRDPVRLRWRPYKEGWTLRLAPGDRLSNELARLAVGRDAQRWLQEEFGRLDRLFEDGALRVPVEGALQRANDAAWSLFEREILKIDNGSAGRSA
jgi:glycine cleavage system H lipoate-binding protein